MSTVTELKDKRYGIISQARTELDKITKEGRSITNEEQNTFDKAMEDAANIEKQIRNLETLAGVEQRNEKRLVVAESTEKVELRERHISERPEYRKAFDKYVRFGKNALNPEETRALVEGSSSGANCVGQEYEKAVTLALQEFNFMRTVCRTITTASNHNIPVETALTTAAWVDEEGGIGVSSDPTIGQKTLEAWKIGAGVKVSVELLQDAVFDLPTYLGGELGKAFAITEQAAFLTGDGNKKPHGIFTDGGLGKTTASASAITGDEIIDFYYSLTAPYRKNCVFAFNDATIKTIRQLKDGEGRYIWVPALGAESDTLLGKPVYSASGIATITNAAAVGIVFNPDYYVIADRMGRMLQRANELYILNGQVLFVMIQRVDGILLNAAAAKKLVMAA